MFKVKKYRVLASLHASVRTVNNPQVQVSLAPCFDVCDEDIVVVELLDQSVIPTRITNIT